MSFPPYPSYQSSDIAWNASLPSHWSTRRLKSLFQLVRRPPADDDKIVTAFRDGQVTLRERRRQDGFTTALQEIGYQGIRAGDLVIHAMDGFAGAIGVSDSDGKSTPVYSVCTPGADADARYFALLLRHMALSGFVTALARGVRERSTEFRWSDASVLRLPCPPLVEQRAIVDFLERETTKTDDLIKEQERLIELLKEKRQAVISYAVTKGIDPTVPMKDSGIDWLGEVPAHWEIVRLSRLVDDRRPITYGIVQPGPFDPSGRYMIRGQDYSRGWADPEMVFRVSNVVEEPYRRARLKKGDVVVTIVGAGTGNSAVVPDVFDGANITQTTARVAPNQVKVEGRYLARLIEADVGKVQTALYQKGAAQPGLNLEHLKGFYFPRPPLAEQRTISDCLEAETILIERLIDQAVAAISLLQERRAAVISAAVTGKIDIRNAAARAEAA